MEIIRKRNKSPGTRRSVEQRNTISRPGTLRRRCDLHLQRVIFAPSRPNKNSREDIAEIDAELMQRARRLGDGYQLSVNLTKETENPNPEEKEIEPEQRETEDSAILRGDNLPIKAWRKFTTEGKEVQYFQINHIVGIRSGNKITGGTIKKPSSNSYLT